jgi:acetolactate synthase small subunit
MTGNETEVNAFIHELAGLGELTEIVRSGALGLTRDARTLRIVQ